MTLVFEQYLQRHELFLEQRIHEASIPSQRLRQALHHAVFPGGKRIRPLLVYLAGAWVDLDLNVLDAIAAAVELTHCYSLVHDDLPAMDDDDYRRGRLSCHKAFDEATAILVGDGMQALAIEILLDRLPALVDSTQVIQVTRTLLQASGLSGMVSGQSLDLSELHDPNISEAQLEQIHQLKTGALISACIQMVLSAAQHVPEDQQKALLTYVHHLGFVFQLQDDYLDKYAPKSSLGKHRASDAANNKTTYATCCSKEALEQHIAFHYQAAMKTLTPFDERATSLLTLTRQLELRTPR